MSRLSEARRALRRPGSLVLLLVLAAVVAHRLLLAVGAGFPINDGGLFVPYIEATRRSFPGLPATVEYNGLVLPNAYPPLGFWLAGALAELGLGAVTAMQVLPVVFNIVWICLLAVLFLRDGHTPLFAAAAVGVLALAFRSYEWLVMGGGLTRGLGAVFLVLTLLALGGTRGREPSPLQARWAVVAGLCVGSALLSHLEWGILAAASVVVQRALRSTSLKGFAVTTTLAGVTAVLVVTPWVLFVLAEHGAEPFLAASGTSAWDLPVTVDRLEGYARAQWPNLLLGVGAAVLLVRRHLFWPIFVLMCVVLTPRHSLTPLVVPASYLTATGLEAVVQAVRRAAVQWREGAEVAAVAAMAVLAVSASALAVDRTRAVNPTFQPLSADVRAAMAWVSEERAGRSFAVVTDPVWYYDASAEWFPALTGATSSTTVQGTEWLPGNAFREREAAVMAIKASASCEELVQRTLELAPVELVWTQTRAGCFRDAGFREVFANPAVFVYEVADAPAGS